MVAWMCCHGEGNRTPRKCRLICEWRDPVPWVDFPGRHFSNFGVRENGPLTGVRDEAWESRRLKPVFPPS